MPVIASLSLSDSKADAKQQQQQQAPAYHRTLVPGQAFPDVRLPKLGGGELALRPSSSDKPRIVVVYRGAFCPFCRVSAAGARYPLWGTTHGRARSREDDVPWPLPRPAIT